MFAKSSDIQSVEQDPFYAEAKANLDRAVAERVLLEAKEKRLRGIMAHNYVGGRGPSPTEEALEEAYAELRPPDPSVTIPVNFILPAADAARKAQPRLQATYLAARLAAQQRLHMEGLSQLKPLFHKLNQAILAAVEAQENCKAFRLRLIEYGADQSALPDLPTALDQEGYVMSQWRISMEQLKQQLAETVVPKSLA